MRQCRPFRARLGERDSVVRFEAVAQVRLIVKAEFFDAIERVKSGLLAFLPKQLVAEKAERLRGRRSDRPQKLPLKRPRADGAGTRGGHDPCAAILGDEKMQRVHNGGIQRLRSDKRKQIVLRGGNPCGKRARFPDSLLRPAESRKDIARRNALPEKQRSVRAREQRHCPGEKPDAELRRGSLRHKTASACSAKMRARVPVQRNDDVGADVGNHADTRPAVARPKTADIRRERRTRRNFCDAVCLRRRGKRGGKNAFERKWHEDSIAHYSHSVCP